MLQAVHELWDFFYYIAYRGKILCAQLLLHPLMDFVHNHTLCCKFYMSYGTLSVYFKIPSGDARENLK